MGEPRGPHEAPSGIRTRVAGLGEAGILDPLEDRGVNRRETQRSFDARAVAARGRLCRPGGQTRWIHAVSMRRGPVGEPGVPPPDCDGWARTSILRVTAGRPALWTTSHREAEAAGLEPASGARRLRASNALPCQLGHASVRASRQRKERESNPQAREGRPFRDGVPRPWQSFPDGPGRRRTCNPPLKRRELCQLSYGAVM